MHTLHSLSKRSSSQHWDPNPAVLSICHKVAANASNGPELDLVPHWSQDPLTSTQISTHPTPTFPGRNPPLGSQKRKGFLKNTQALGIGDLGEDWDGRRKGKVEKKPKRENKSKETQWEQVVRCSMKAKLRNHNGATCHSLHQAQDPSSSA